MAASPGAAPGGAAAAPSQSASAASEVAVPHQRQSDAGSSSTSVAPTKSANSKRTRRISAAAALTVRPARIQVPVPPPAPANPVTVYHRSPPDPTMAVLGGLPLAPAIFFGCLGEINRQIAQSSIHSLRPGTNTSPRRDPPRISPTLPPTSSAPGAVLLSSFLLVNYLLPRMRAALNMESSENPVRAPCSFVYSLPRAPIADSNPPRPRSTLAFVAALVLGTLN